MRIKRRTRQRQKNRTIYIHDIVRFFCVQTRLLKTDMKFKISQYDNFDT